MVELWAHLAIKRARLGTLYKRTDLPQIYPDPEKSVKFFK
jgi:hypothetical protein